MKLQLPELLLGVGTLSKLRTAIAFGADAVYCGAAGLSMRPDASSFGPGELQEGVRLCHEAGGKKLYVAVNSMYFDEDLNRFSSWLEETRDTPIDALILADAGAFSLARELRPELELHMSTQLSTSNTAGAAFWKTAGASRVVLARECSLAQAGAIAQNSGVEIEIFVHGAMCMAVSGRCLLSAQVCGKSANRGQCKQSCRWEWEVVEKKRPDQPMTLIEIDRKTIMFGSTDLCMIDHIPDLIGSGVQSLKVEGRMKSEYYVAMVARTYRAALDCFAANPDAFEINPQWREDLESVPHRPYEHGFAFGYPEQNPESLQTDSRPVSTHRFVGRVIDAETVDIRNRFSVGDSLEWVGPGLEGGTLRVPPMLDAKGKPVERCHAGTQVTMAHGLPVNTILRSRIGARNTPVI